MWHGRRSLGNTTNYSNPRCFTCSPCCTSSSSWTMNPSCRCRTPSVSHPAVAAAVGGLGTQASALSQSCIRGRLWPQLVVGPAAACWSRNCWMCSQLTYCSNTAAAAAPRSSWWPTAGWVSRAVVSGWAPHTNLPRIGCTCSVRPCRHSDYKSIPCPEWRSHKSAALGEDCWRPLQFRRRRVLANDEK